MSGIGRTNSGSGGGGISSNAALLVVYAPLGSIVTATKDGIAKTSKKDIALSDRPMVGMHMFSVGSSQFGTWTITATRDSDTNSKTEIINAVRLYEIYIGYDVPLDLYQQVEYLSSTSAKTQYIDTNIGAFDSFDVDFQYMEMYSGQSLHSVLGCRNGQSKQLMMGVTTWGGKFDIRPPTTNTVSNYTRTMDLNRHRVQSGEYFNKQIIFDGDIVFTYTPTQNFPNITGFLFNEHQGANAAGPSYSRIYSAKIWKNGNLEREFYPCYRVSDSVAGMYDKVNDVFYANAGSGTFIVGADV